MEAAIGEMPTTRQEEVAPRNRLAEGKLKRGYHRRCDIVLRTSALYGGNKQLFSATSSHMPRITTVLQKENFCNIFEYLPLRPFEIF